MLRTFLPKKLTMALLLCATFIFSVNTHALIKIVAAENIYGEVARELGGQYVEVMSILNNPSQDPHLFTTTPSTAKAIHQANIVVYNGANYDPWINSMLATPNQKRTVFNIGALVQAKVGDNPHLWYSPTTIPIFAKTLTTQLIHDDPDHEAYYVERLQHFHHQYLVIFRTINRLKQRFEHTPIIATEPVFGYMAKSVGLKILGEDFQTNMMNGLPPTISQIKSFEDDLLHHRATLLIYNNQVMNPLTDRMRLLAEKNHIPVLGVSEMIPPQTRYIEWIMSELIALDQALVKGRGH